MRHCQGGHSGIGGRSREGGQLDTRPYSTAPTKNAVENLANYTRLKPHGAFAEGAKSTPRRNAGHCAITRLLQIQISSMQCPLGILFARGVR